MPTLNFSQPNRLTRFAQTLLLSLCLACMASTNLAQVPKSPDSTSTATEPSAFDVASIRPSTSDEPPSMQKLPNGFHIADFPLLSTVIFAYYPFDQWITNWSQYRVIGAPAWVKNDHYTIEARVAESEVQAWQAQTKDMPMLQQKLQTLLAERCKLVVHHTTAEVPIYALVTSSHGAQLKQSTPGEPMPKGAFHLAGGGFFLYPPNSGETLKVRYLNLSMASFARELSRLTNRPVVDETGLTGTYDFDLSRIDDPGTKQSDPKAATEWNLNALGFKLVPARRNIDAVVIDHIEKPSPN